MVELETEPILGQEVPRRPSNAAEFEFVEHVGVKEWVELENLAIARGEVDVPDEDTERNVCGYKFKFSWRTLWAYAGPGWLMSIAFVDPGNLESDLQAGAYGGYQLIWVLLFATIMGFFLQVLSVRLGVVTGKNLAEMCHLMYPRWTSYVLWFMAEVAIVGSDVQEVLGSAIALQILFKLPLWGSCQEIGLSGAGIALSGVLNEYSETIWAIGLLAAGQSSTMAGTYAGQFVMEGFLNIRLPPWKRVALTRAVALVPALSVAIWSDADSSDSDSMNEFLNVLQSVQLPFALIPILHFTSNPLLMGPFANGFKMRCLGWIVTTLVCFVNIYLVIEKVNLGDLSSLGQVGAVVTGLAYFAFLGYLVALEFIRLLAEK
ncbi:unnamed protein product [Aphanomyces euteiches]